MMLRLELRGVDPALRAGSVVRWLKREGDSIEFGDELCVLAMDEFAVLRRTARASLLATRRRKRLKSDLETRQGVYVEVVVSSADRGVLRSILCDPGDRVAQGQLLGLVSTSDDDTVAVGSERAWRDAPAMRVAVNPLDRSRAHEEDV